MNENEVPNGKISLIDDEGTIITRKIGTGIREGETSGIIRVNRSCDAKTGQIRQSTISHLATLGVLPVLDNYEVIVENKTKFHTKDMRPSEQTTRQIEDMLDDQSSYSAVVFDAYGEFKSTIPTKKIDIFFDDTPPYIGISASFDVNWIVDNALDKGGLFACSLVENLDKSLSSFCVHDLCVSLGLDVVNGEELGPGLEREDIISLVKKVLTSFDNAAMGTFELQSRPSSLASRIQSMCDVTDPKKYGWAVRHQPTNLLLEVVETLYEQLGYDEDEIDVNALRELTTDMQNARIMRAIWNGYLAISEAKENGESTFSIYDGMLLDANKTDRIGYELGIDAALEAVKEGVSIKDLLRGMA